MNKFAIAISIGIFMPVITIPLFVLGLVNDVLFSYIGWALVAIQISCVIYVARRQ